MRLRNTLLVLALGVSSATASADEVRHYDNPRYGYGIDVPAGFGPMREADNSDGITVRSRTSNAELFVWGETLLDDSFTSEVASRVEDAENRGFEIAYRKVTASAASWSGADEDRIFYSRAIPLCREAIGLFRIEYDRSAKEDFDPIVKALVESFRSEGC